MSYHTLHTPNNIRRSFAITMGLTEGYGPNSHTHEPTKAHQVALDWMQARAEVDQDYLTGLFTPATLAYAWKAKGQVTPRVEPALVFSGDISVAYLANLTDGQVIELLNELADRFGHALGQTRIYITYRDQAWIRQAEGQTSPRQPNSPPPSPV